MHTRPMIATVGLSSVFFVGAALGQVAGSVAVGVTAEEQRVIATGWSVERQILGRSVYNEAGETIGRVKDIILTPERAVSYAILAAGGFLGLGEHDVLIPVEQFRLESGQLVLPGATKQLLTDLPRFRYAEAE